MGNQNQILHCYCAYKLGINSSLLLPELITSAEVKQDVVIRLDLFNNILSNNLHSNTSYSVSLKKAQLYFTKVGTFFINEGNEINIVPLPNIEEQLIRLPLLGVVLSVLLYQRGNYVLHASSVAFGDKAIAFVGNKGDGKSTMSAALCGRGHKLLTDDTAAIEFDETNYPIALPGFPQFKLYPDSVLAATNDNPDDLPEIASNLGKRSRKAENFCQKSLPLKAIYVLEEGTKISITQLAPQAALQAVIANSYMARFTNDWIKNGIAAKTFHQCTSVINQIPVYSLKRPRDLSILNDVSAAVEEHCLNS